MSQIIKINSPKAILGRTNENEIVDLNKAYEEGVYCDSPANRKLGRVGMTYKEFAEKKNKEEQNKKGGSGHDGGGDDGNDSGDWKKGLDEDSINEVEQLIQAHHQNEGSGYDEELYERTSSAISDIIGSDKAEKVLKQEGINKPVEEKEEKPKKGGVKILKFKDKNAKAINDFCQKLKEETEISSRVFNYIKKNLSIDKDGTIHAIGNFEGKDYAEIRDNINTNITDDHYWHYKGEPYRQLAMLVTILNGNKISDIDIEKITAKNLGENFDSKADKVYEKYEKEWDEAQDKVREEAFEKLKPLKEKIDKYLDKLDKENKGELDIRVEPKLYQSASGNIYGTYLKISVGNYKSGFDKDTLDSIKKKFDHFANEENENSKLSIEQKDGWAPNFKGDDNRFSFYETEIGIYSDDIMWENPLGKRRKFIDKKVNKTAKEYASTFLKDSKK